MLLTDVMKGFTTFTLVLMMILAEVNHDNVIFLVPGLIISILTTAVVSYMRPIRIRFF
jgi:hypothetical protein